MPDFEQYFLNIITHYCKDNKLQFKETEYDKTIDNIISDDVKEKTRIIKDCGNNKKVLIKIDLKKK